ncbi:uncharacterized protein EDB93DRAFT_1253786 [Suillus bovinus]|uniref:uncharacterized protein n=1 Tax=Suillus bovinus TaxID=48563 RepID=UPI001B87E3DF|nr:uncharacterized protein EDB93DRAFT_1253786 [Suillus bovinus]KAG2136925.1 hypothetical protein EDB93DRAFT_1253786 [Suillus bovinus]
MDEECNLVIIPNNTIYSVQTMQVYYITYDLQRKYDTINPRTHGDIMVLSGETRPSHPYCEAAVLWVRWLAGLWGYKSGTKHTRLPKVAIVEESDRDTFRFLDPGQDVVSAHFARESRWHALGGSWRIEKNITLGYSSTEACSCAIHLGIGHSTMLRKITRDCLGSDLMANHVVNNSDQEHADDEETGDGEDHYKHDDGQGGSDDEGDEECDDSDLEPSDGELPDEGEEYGDEFGDMLNDLSF